MDKILEDHCRAAGVWSGRVAAALNAEQIAELREYAEKQPLLSYDRKEFMEAARLAELNNVAREAARESKQSQVREPSVTSREQSRTREGATISRADRDSSFRGR